MGNEVEIVVTGTNRTGNAFNSVRKDAKSLAGDIGKEMDKVGKTIKGKRTQLFREGQQAGETFTFGLLKTFQTLPAQAQVGLIAGISALGPVIGGALNAAVLAGVGGAGLAGGIALAARDPRVKSAFGDFGKSAMEGLTDASDVFVEPLVKSAGKLRTAFSGDILKGIKQDFALLSPLVDKLTDGVIGFAQKAMPGINAAVKASVPVLSQLAKELPGIGAAFSDMMKQLSDSSAGAVTGIKLLGSTIKGTFALIGFSIGNASRELAAFDALLHGDFIGSLGQASAAGATFPKWLIDTLRYMGPTGQATADLAENLGLLAPIIGETGAAGQGLGQSIGTALKDVADKSAEAKNSADNLKVSWQQMFDTLTQQRDTALDFNQLLLDIDDTVKKNGTDLSEHTDKGIANNKMISDGIGLIGQHRKEMDNGRTSAAYMNDEIERQARAFEDSMVAAGFNREAVHKLISEQLQIPKSVTTQYNDPGLAAELAAAQGLRSLTETINGRVVTTTFVTNQITRYTTQYGTTVENQGSVSAIGGGRSIARAMGGISGAAGGGPRSRRTWVGEYGPEIVDLAPGSTVHSNSDSRRMMKQDSGGGVNTLEISAAPGLGGKFEDAIIDFLLKSLRNNRGGLRTAVGNA